MSTKRSAIGRPDARGTTRRALSAAAFAVAMLLLPLPAEAGDRARAGDWAQADDRWSETCVASWGVYSCVDQWGSPGGIAKVIPVPGPRDDQEANAYAERERHWAARCRPTSHVDRYGVRRFHYAAPGCEFGRHED
jgi:hypothetical protein